MYVCARMQASTYCYEECEQLKVKLEAAYRRGDLPLVGVPLLNTYVAARFSEDKQLYRARVIGWSCDVLQGSSGMFICVFVYRGI